MPKPLPNILSIAASDPMGGAGIQADIKTGALLGIHVNTTITAVTVQNSKGFKSLNPCASALIKEQLDVIVEDVWPQAVKIGLIGNIENLETVSSFLGRLPSGTPVVADPIIAPTLADNISQREKKLYIDAYKKLIFPRVTVITPNLPELELMTEITSLEILPRTLSVNALILKGGHSDSDFIEDILIENNKITKSIHKRILSENLHGTGCVFSTLLASFMAFGDSLNVAFKKTCEKLFEIIRCSMDYRLGNSCYGPLNINNYRL